MPTEAKARKLVELLAKVELDARYWGELANLTSRAVGRGTDLGDHRALPGRHQCHY